MKKNENNSLVLRRDVFQHCLILYPQEIWDAQVDAVSARTNMFDRRGREALRRFVAGAEVVTLDSGGRILIPKRYLEEANIESELRFIGVDNIIEIWNRKTAEELLNEPDTLADELENMMNGLEV